MHCMTAASLEMSDEPIFLNENESEMTKSWLLRHFFGGFSSVNFRDNILTKRRAREATETAGRAPRHASET